LEILYRRERSPKEAPKGVRWSFVEAGMVAYYGRAWYEGPQDSCRKTAAQKIEGKNSLKKTAEYFFAVF